MIRNRVPLKNCCAIAATDIMRDLRGETFVVHQKKVDFSYVADEKLLQAVGEKMSGLYDMVSYDAHYLLIVDSHLLVASVTNL